MLNSSGNSLSQPAALAPTTAPTPHGCHDEQRLRTNEQLLYGIISSALDAIIVIDETHCITLFNRAAEQMFRCQAADILGKPILQFVPNRFRGHHGALIEAFAHRANPMRAMGHPVEIFGLRATGEEFPIEASIAKVAVADHNLFTVILRDITERKENEQRIRTSEARFRELADAMPQIVFTTDAEGNFEYHNHYADQVIGERLPATWLALFHPDDRAHVHTEWARALQTGESYQIEHRIYHAATNDYRWYLGRALPIRDQTGQITKWYGTATDIHEQKQAEAELRRTTALLRAVTDGATDAIFVKGCDGRYLLCNPATAQALGYPAEAILGHDDRSFFAEPVAAQIMARDQQIMQSGNADTQEAQFTIKGAIKTYLSTKAPYRDEQNKIIGVIGISHDITARKAAEEVIRESERRLQMALSTAHMGVWEWVARTNSIYWSTECNEIFGVDHFDNTIEGFSRLIHPEDAERAIQLLEESLRKQEPYSAEFRIRRADGTTHWVAHRGQGSYDESGALTAVVGTVQEITERVQLEEQLRQSQKMEAVGQLAGGVAHDFNNLLTVITGYSDLLLTKLPIDERNRTLIAQIRHAGERATALTRQLLAFSRKQLLEPKVVALNEIVSNMEKMLKRLIGEDILLTVKLATALGQIMVDPHQIEQVLMNLAINARDAMPQGGQLTIETQEVARDRDYCRLHPEAKPGCYIQLTMSDTGYGMTPEVKEHIFEPFFTTKGPGKGTGLGLATVFGIIKQSEGYMEVESALNVGSSFKIYLPVINGNGRVAAAADLPSALPTHGNEHILLVEDDDAVRRITRLALEGYGYQVLEASDGPSAIKLAAAHSVALDLLLTDVVMPQLGGGQLAQQLHTQYPQLKVLFMSGYIDDAVVRHHIADNKSAFIHKPFSPTALAQKVREVLDRENPV